MVDVRWVFFGAGEKRVRMAGCRPDCRRAFPAGRLCLAGEGGMSLPLQAQGASSLQQRGADVQRRREDQGSPHGYHPGHHRRWKQLSTRNHCLTNLSITPSVGMSPVGLSAFGDSSGPTFPDRRGDLCGTLREKGPSLNVPITALAFCRKRTEMGAKGPKYSRGHSPLTSWT